MSAFIARVKRAQTLEKAVRSAESIIGYIGWVLLFGMMLLGAADVIGRYVFNSPIIGTQEISCLWMGGIVFFAWAHVLSKKGHISVDIVFRHYPPRAQAVVEFVSLFLSLVLFSLIIWQAWSAAMIAWQENRLTEIIQMPLAPFKFWIPFGAFFLCLECIIQMVHLVPEMRRKMES